LINFEPFQGEEHQPFHWQAGRPAALLVHGFPGTPAELRPLARSLLEIGWTVQAPLLPGFGPQIGTLPQRQAEEWVAAVQAALIELQRQHWPVLLLGYSMGAALALQVAATQPPSGLALLAPFQQLGNRRQQLVGLLLKPFFRQLKPFQKTDFADPQVRRGISNFFSGLDLDDPNVQQSLRELTVPVSILEQVQKVGRRATGQAWQVRLPTLTIQGTRDEVVDPAGSRKLLQRLGGPIHYVELVAGHDLLDPTRPAWPQVEHTILDFANSLHEEFSLPKERERPT
jgi:carboxylesterase